MQCKECNKENRDNLRFCEFCGAKLEETKVPDPILCSTCGEQNREGVLFCEHCGEKLTTEIPTKEEPPTGPTCPDCGRENRRGVKFCEFCGGLMKSPLIPPRQPQKKKIKPIYFLIPAGALLVVVLMVCLFAGILFRNRSTSPNLQPPVTTPDREGAIAIPNYGDFKNLTVEQAQEIGNAIVQHHYPNLDLTTSPDVAHTVENGKDFIDVVYGVEISADNSALFNHVIIIQINTDDQTITILESN